MNITITEDDRMLSDALNRFCQEVIAPKAAEIDEGSLSSTCHRQALSDIGIMGMNLPEACGGTGVSAVALYLAVENLAGACGSTASMVTAHFLATDSILLGGTEAQKQAWLPDAATGSKLGAFALTEPAAGSNPAAMRTFAEKTATGYRLRGVKHFISNAAEADFLVVYAKTDKSAGHRGISAFIVDRHSAGIEVASPERTMGLKGDMYSKSRWTAKCRRKTCSAASRATAFVPPCRCSTTVVSKSPPVAPASPAPPMRLRCSGPIPARSTTIRSASSRDCSG
ncbi:acyl-CoA dehydrogenase family protein [Marinobacterium aestuariivivens]|uniref:Acyl-CoA dehydrogenase family protein n=1 Tax=Marinobacterium aestuariivivens TaxID=1698799 RepID=A0ABW2A6F9_9GAMM